MSKRFEQLSETLVPNNTLKIDRFKLALVFFGFIHLDGLHQFICETRQ